MPVRPKNSRLSRGVVEIFPSVPTVICSFFAVAAASLALAMPLQRPTAVVSSNRFVQFRFAGFEVTKRFSFPLMWNRGANHYLLSEAHTGCPQALKISTDIIPSGRKGVSVEITADVL